MTIEKIIENLTSVLQLNKNLFKESSIANAIEMMNSYYRVALFYSLTDFKSMMVNDNIISNIISENITSPNNLVFKERLSNWVRFLDNEIRFFVSSNTYVLGMLTHSINIKFGDLFKELALKCYNEYWDFNNDKIQELKESIWDFKGYLDILVSDGEVDSIRRKGLNFNIKGWNNYIINLVEIFFEDFKLSKKYSNHNIRFLKQINEDWLLGFEYNKRILNKSAKSGFLEFPEYFNLILIKKEYDKKEKSDYVYNFDSEYIISLDILANPFFFYPTMSSMSFESARLLKFTPPLFYELVNLQSYVKDGDGMTMILHNQEHGDLVKIYLYFYMDILIFTSKGYLQYVENCLLDIISNKASN